MKFLRTDRLTAATSALALAVLLVGVGCSNSNNNPTEPEVVVEVPLFTETFTGSFGQNGTSEHRFTTVETGDVELTVTSLEPVPTLTVGLSLANFVAGNDPECSVIASDNRVVVGAILLSTRRAPGEYCVVIGDVGNVFPDATVTYSVSVTHP